MRYLFRADASLVIGSGHIMRCMSLANVLRARGAQTCFVALELPAHLHSMLRAQGHEIRMLPEYVLGDERADAQATLHGEKLLTACVVDHYKLGASWEAAVMPHARVLALDDIDRAHVSQWLLDPNYCAQPETRYTAHCHAHVQRLLGPTYALLRNEFVQARTQANVRDGVIRHILVFLGGMDSDNVTALALEAIDQGIAENVFVTVIAGASHPDLSGLREWCCRRGHATLHVQVSDMTPHLLTADLAIGAGGSSTWERCACGLPTVTICVADNQRELILEGTRAGFLWGIDHVPSAEKLAAVLKALSSAPGLVQHMSRQALQVTDGRGAIRVADLLMPRMMQVRQATQEDARMIFEWRTTPEVMGVSRNTDPIMYEAHCAWMTRVLADPNRLLLVGLLEGRDAGVVRFDMDGCCAEVSIFLAPGAIGFGLGRALLTAAEARLRQDHPQVKTLSAWVKKDNPRSLQLFQHLGYFHRDSRLEKEFA